jgi:hypothetical protein
MTSLTVVGYCLCMMKDWKYKGAFVIQFQPETNFETGLCRGRVEHITSYKAMRFRSLEELLAFVAQVLTEARADEEHEREETA